MVMLEIIPSTLCILYDFHCHTISKSLIYLKEFLLSCLELITSVYKLIYLAEISVYFSIFKSFQLREKHSKLFCNVYSQELMDSCFIKNECKLC